MLNKKLTTKEYYLSKLSMFLKESYGVTAQMELLVEWIQSVDNLSDVSLSCYDIWNKNYKEDLKRIVPNNEDFKPLDNLAELFGFQRYMKLNYFDQVAQKDVSEVLHFSNDDLIDLIKIKVIQNNYQGTLQELIDLYAEKLDYTIYISLAKNPANVTRYRSAFCIVYLEEKKKNGETISENLKKMFSYSDLFLQSLGIEYDLLLTSSISNILVLDKIYPNDDTQWALYSDDPNAPSYYKNGIIVLG